MKGKLIIIEAGDGSGKQTQAEKLYERLASEGISVRKIEYPNYKSESSALIKMYLRGEFGTDPNAVNPYAASTFYAVDRYASFKREWEQFYLAGGVLIADRYTTSNMVHQAVKLESGEAKAKFLDWLWDLEFNLFGLPVPDCVLFLDMPPEFSARLIAERNKQTGNVVKDIHENNQKYLSDCYQNYKWLAWRYNWQIIHCTEGDRLKTVAEIHKDIYTVIEPFMRPKPL